MIHPKKEILFTFFDMIQLSINVTERANFCSFYTFLQKYSISLAYSTVETTLLQIVLCYA
jgi:hypothetical protein